MKIVFFGTPDYVLPVLDALHKEFKSKSGKSPLVAVVTQPPKPTGRKQELTYSAVDNWAFKKKVPIYFNMEELIKNAVSADVGILASYGALLPNQAINYFPHGILVVHPSLLPQFRWSSPIQAAMVTATNPTGVTIIKMDEKFDHGPIISQFEEEVFETDTAGTLRARLFERSAEVLVALFPAYLAGKITPREQDHKKATFARMVTKQDAFIPPKFLNAALLGASFKSAWKILFIKDYSLTPNSNTLERFIRAMQPWPIAWTLVKLKVKSENSKVMKLKIHKAHLEGKKLILDVVQLEGKNPVSWKQFKDAYPETQFS